MENKKKMVRVTFRVETYIEGETLAQIKSSFEGTGLKDMHLDFVELVSVEDAEDLRDITDEWKASDRKGYSQPLRMVADRDETQWGVLLNDGRIISLYDGNNQFYLRWDFPIDLDTLTYEPCRSADTENGEVSLYWLASHGLISGELFCCDKVEYTPGTEMYPDDFVCPKQVDDEIDRIVGFFKGKGYSVTREAVEHNINAWMRDSKSGYRDDGNGFHLFSPCGCNPLSVRLSTLHDLCSDWQVTYTE